MVFHDPRERATKQLAPGVTARTFWGDKMLMAQVEFEPGGVVPLHSHPHEQVGFLIAGELDFTVGDERRLVRPGEIWVIPGGVEHTVTAGRDGATAMDIFSPVREEYQY
jgi:quercetin dioxygenase-like cupin family protein